METQMFQKEISDRYKTFNSVPKTNKIEEMLMKNLNELLKAFSNIDQNLKTVKLKAEEFKDESLGEASSIIEIEQQNVNNLVTSSFHKMKEYLHAVKDCQTQNLKDPQGDFTSAVQQNSKRNIHDEGRGSFGIASANLKENNHAENDDKEDSDEDTIFYDAFDDLIMNEIEKEVRRDYKPHEYTDLEIRTTLPALKTEGKFSLLKILKDAVGKDLTKFCVPVYFNEPFSLLQKLAEVMQQDHLMDKASKTEDPMLRIIYVASIFTSIYSHTLQRMSKPFNPILGETFEYIGDGWKLISEQVSHHPPISVTHVMSEKYEITSVTRMSTAFWGKSLEFKAHGKASVKFLDTGDYFLVTRPNTACRNIIFGNMYLENYGKLLVENLRTGDKCELELNKATNGYFSKNKKS
jgi:hypothetical protein